MQRSHLLRWLPSRWLRGLALAVGLFGTQCLDSISDDCTKTLTCGDEQRPRLQPNCRWEYPNGQLWAGAPHYDVATKTWRWPDNTPTSSQDFECDLNLLVDAGVDDAGLTNPRCGLDFTCDSGQVCDPATDDCVQCVTDAECAGNMPMGDAGAATVCDPGSHRCVECLGDDNCSGDASVCKLDAANSRRNRCVECLTEATCSDPAPICDERSNECTAACRSASECTGDKQACNTELSICVECTDSSYCSGTPGKPLCDTDSNQCVECLDDAPCAASGRVCDLESHSCVQCREDAQCTMAGLAFCDTETKQCVQCLNDLQCTAGTASRCSAAHVCTGCTDSSQCEQGAQCRGGTCVECLNNTHCADKPGEPLCETTNGVCVACLDDSQCRNAGAAHCETNPNLPLEQRYQCVGCVGNDDCTGDGKGLPPLCDPDKGTGTCVECTIDEGTADCFSLGPNRSRCQNGSCTACSLDSDCSLFDDTPACNPGVGCVECTESTDCGGATPVCKLAAGGGTEPVNTCVECVDNADCQAKPDASLCQDNQCVPCVADGDCSLVDSNGIVAGGTPQHVCDSGTCVQCNARNPENCGTNVCNSLTKACSNFPVGSAGPCDECVSDAQCAANSRCVQQTIGGTPQYFCYPLQSPSSLCTTNGFADQQSVATIDSPSAAVCLQRETTCPAFVDYVSGQECDDTNDDEACGTEGSCELGPQGFRCTISCISAADCSGGSCLSGLCEL